MYTTGGERPLYASMVPDTPIPRAGTESRDKCSEHLRVKKVLASPCTVQRGTCRNMFEMVGVSKNVTKRESDVALADRRHSANIQPPAATDHALFRRPGCLGLSGQW